MIFLLVSNLQNYFKAEYVLRKSPLGIVLSSFWLFLAIIIMPHNHLFAQNPRSNLDVLNYDLDLRLSDQSDTIFVKETVLFEVKKDGHLPSFDLASIDEKGRGMNIKTLLVNGMYGTYTHSGNEVELIEVYLKSGVPNELQVTYSGIPKDGLIIGKNKFGSRTFFADNWPNRAHHWMLCVDHPSDKATISCNVHAPKHYQVIANGLLQEEPTTSDEWRVWKYRCNVPLPTKVMVVGVSDFSVQNLLPGSAIPQSGWAYPEGQKQAQSDFKMAPAILDFYIDYFGEYPFEKLAHVQSTTRYGGMENASCIFYDENALDGTGTSEDLIAHETVHQWFGNSVTECDWSHLWLSEGFATYFTNVYLEKTKGEEVFRNQMRADRERVIQFKSYRNPLVDTVYKNVNDLLNTNAYQKGSWVLHMLRMELGDSLFQQVIRTFYSSFREKNVCTKDLKEISESIYNKDLDYFFKQWCHQSGHPVLSKHVSHMKGSVTITISQTGGIFDFPLEVALVDKKGNEKLVKLQITKSSETFTFETKHTIASVKLDPEVKLLFEEK